MQSLTKNNFLNILSLNITKWFCPRIKRLYGRLSVCGHEYVPIYEIALFDKCTK